MKILNICSNRWNSAITEYALSSGLALESAGNIVVNLGLTDRPFCQRSKANNQEVISIVDFRFIRAFEFSEILKRINPDLVITHGGPETVLSCISHVKHFPLIRVRGYRSERIGKFQNRKGIFTRFNYFFNYPRVSGLVVPSEKIDAEFSLHTKLPRKCIRLGLNANKVKKEVEWRRPDRPTLLIFGRLDPIKGHREFMKQFKTILSISTPEFRPFLKIVGLPANISEADIRKSALELDLNWGSDVDLVTKRVENVNELLAGVTAGVVPSLGSEDICRVAQEFLLCGTPVIVSDVGALSEVLSHPCFGVSYRELNSADFAKSFLAKLAVMQSENDAERTKRSKLANDEFSLQKMGREWMEFIRIFAV